MKICSKCGRECDIRVGTYYDEKGNISCNKCGLRKVVESYKNDKHVCDLFAPIVKEKYPELYDKWETPEEFRKLLLEIIDKYSPY